MAIYISGSLAYDRVMTFPGVFSDYILPDKIHMLNVAFPIKGIEEKRGGTAGNIAYNLALLGEKPVILASAGRDFGSYKEFLARLGLSLAGVRQLPDELTAGAYITTDQRSNQITGFHLAAMGTPCGYAFPCLDPERDIAIIAPTNVLDMEGHARLYHEKGTRYIFDPGQQIADLGAERLISGIRGAMMLVSNDYELELILRLTDLSLDKLLELSPVVITTMGGQGSRLTRRGGGEAHIAPAGSIKEPLDPTGAGDAYRAGLLKALLYGLGLEDAMRLGSACASFCVEKHGTQEHFFDGKALRIRLKEAYGLDLPLDMEPLEGARK